MGESEAVVKKVPWKDGFTALWLFSRGIRLQIGILLALSMLSAVGNGIVPYLIGRFFDALSQGGEELSLVYITFGIWVGVQLFTGAIDSYSRFVESKADLKLHLNIQHLGLTKLMRLPVAFHKQERISEVFEMISRAGWMGSSTLRSIWNILPQLLAVFVGISIAYSIDWRLASVLVAGAFIYTCIIVIVVRNASAIFREGNDSWSKAWGDVSSSAQHIDTIKASASEDYEENKAKKAFFSDAFFPWLRMEQVWSITGVYQRMVVLAVQATILFSSIYLVTQGSLTIGELIMFNGYALMFLGPFVAFGYQWQTIQNGIVAAAKLKTTVLDYPSEVYEPEGAISVDSIRGDVRFDHVSFKYSDGDKETLTDISFEAQQGETVAFVGESGVGKSTLISLILATNFPTGGTVYVDGKDTRTYKLMDLRSHIAVVPQEIALFNDTVETNVKYGSFEATHEEVVRAATSAQAHDFIESLPKGYDTIVGERGVKLSVGQKQRLAIARAMLRNPAILILDEPTSALDAKTETELSASLEILMEGRTTFIVAHRLSTVRKADKIVVIEGGKVVETGKHDELLKIKGGRYRMLHEHQIGLHG